MNWLGLRDWIRAEWDWTRSGGARFGFSFSWSMEFKTGEDMIVPIGNSGGITLSPSKSLPCTYHPLFLERKPCVLIWLESSTV